MDCSSGEPKGLHTDTAWVCVAVPVLHLRNNWCVARMSYRLTIIVVVLVALLATLMKDESNKPKSSLLQGKLVHKKEYPLKTSVLGFAVIQLPDGKSVEIRYDRPLTAKQGERVSVERVVSYVPYLRWGGREEIEYKLDSSEFKSER